MQPNLWAPWRIDYLRALGGEGNDDCFLCAARDHPDQDDQRLVVERRDGGMILLNRYPYTNGHLLVALEKHAADLTDLEADEHQHLMALVVRAETILKNAMDPQGVNIGINIGRSAGAGLPGHLHVHLVPRWGGDVNFMEVVGQVRVIPQALEQIHTEMRRAAAAT